MDADPDPRIAEFDATSPEGKLRLIYLAALDIAAWLQQIENALTEVEGADDEEDGDPLSRFTPTGFEN